MAGSCSTNVTQMWCVTDSSLGLISSDVIQVSLVNPVGT